MIEENEIFDEFDETEETEDGALFEHYNIVVDPGQTLLRIDKFLSNRLMNATRSRLQAAADEGKILVNKLPVKSSYKVKPGDEISIVMDYPRRELKIIAEDIPLLSNLLSGVFPGSTIPAITEIKLREQLNKVC